MVLPRGILTKCISWLLFPLVISFVLVSLGPPAFGAENEPNLPPPSTRTEIKDLLETALFSPTWRSPEAVEWVVLQNKSVQVGLFLPSNLKQKHYEPEFQRLGTTVARLQKKIQFPYVDPNQKLVTADEFMANWNGSDPFALISSSPRDPFEKLMKFHSSMFGHEIFDTERYIKRGCFYPPGSQKGGIKEGVFANIWSDLPDAEFDKCVADILYLAHGIWAEDAPYKDIVLKIMYDPMVRPGMTREALFELVDQDVFDHLLAR